jgi:hypothetical protein
VSKQIAEEFLAKAIFDGIPSVGNINDLAKSGEV